MYRAGICLAAIIDGQKAWEQVCGEIRRTMDDPLRGLPVVGLLVLVLLVIWANVRLARWLVASTAGAVSGSHHPVHHNEPTDES